MSNIELLNFCQELINLGWARVDLSPIKEKIPALRKVCGSVEGVIEFNDIDDYGFLIYVRFYERNGSIPTGTLVYDNTDLPNLIDEDFMEECSIDEARGAYKENT